MRRSVMLPLVASLVFFGCKDRGAAPAAARDAGVLETRDAAFVEASAPIDAATGRAAKRENLLQVVPAKVAVSSAVENPRDFPEHLVDGKTDTAWNGATGDLRGAWIAFRVPRDARVEHVEMTVGFDKKTATTDLFTANHRIKRVIVLRDGKKLREVELDIEDRAAQRVPVDADGGDFKIEVAETVAGTKPEWREVVVSELSVIGRPGRARRAAGDPVRIAIGNLDGDPSGGARLDHYDLGRRSIRTADGLCASLSAADVQSCKVRSLAIPFTGDATYKSIRVVDIVSSTSEQSRLVVELPRGFVDTGVSVAWDDGMNCASVWRASGAESAYLENGHLVVTIAGWTLGYVEDPALDHGSLMRGAAWCREAGGALSCWSYSPQYNPPLAVKGSPRGPFVPWAELPWSAQRAFHLSPTGAFIIQ